VAWDFAEFANLRAADFRLESTSAPARLYAKDCLGETYLFLLVAKYGEGKYFVRNCTTREEFITDELPV
jgi:hypothetical protein